MSVDAGVVAEASVEVIGPSHEEEVTHENEEGHRLTTDREDRALDATVTDTHQTTEEMIG